MITTVMLIVSLFPLIDSSEGSDSDPFEILLLDDSEKKLNDPLFNNVTFYFDTTNNDGSIEYRLKAMYTVDTVPVKFIVRSNGGSFDVHITMDGLTSFLADTGVRITLTSDTDEFTADLTSSNNYSSIFSSETAPAFKPNVKYELSITTLDAYNTEVSPTSIDDIKVTFKANISSGYHQIMFVSENDIIEQYIAPDNYIIDKTPSVSRIGFDFKGWFTVDGREITDGYVVSPEEGDIVAYAKWESNGEEGFPVAIPIIGGIISALAIAGIIIFVLKKKKNGAAE